MAERIGLGSFGLISANLQFGSLLGRYDHSLGEPVCLTRTTLVNNLRRRCHQMGGDLADQETN